ncbi:imidazole glycerol phosphate synthase subunit HisH [Leptospira wolbachii]|nr:imidazole glycerol phosphate synthase subunit HisH [Leptospira wolbachii]
MVDYGVGNTFSIQNALTYLGYSKVYITSDETEIKSMDALIFPGVGAFDEACKQLAARNLDKILTEEVIGRKKPILGICLGMQLFASSSEENGLHQGLNWIPGKVVKIVTSSHLPVPHVGWNDITIQKTDPLFNKNSNHVNFYFDHSFHFECEPAFVSSWCEYGIRLTASVQKENVFGVQFHPEKSHISGLKLFRSFLTSV